MGARGLRVRIKQSSAEQSIFNLENPRFVNEWPPIDQIGHPITPFRCRETLRHLEILEVQKLQQMRKFQMPRICLGDLVEVRYELCRTKQTFAVFQDLYIRSVSSNFFTGFCVDLRLKGLGSSFVLKNTYDGVGVEQLFPFYSVRLLNVRVIRSVKNTNTEEILKAQMQKPSTRDYRYKWHYNIRHKFERSLGKHKPGIRSMEPKIRRRLQKIARKYLRQRIESGLPPYVWRGPYNILSRRRSRSEE
ncbi:ribosomal protein L19 protein [Cardiosporidium cionae]|uniref:50S ribosomal protein L19, chloroplastic n=1 Tax=Cardiosporidium cionae TaxID=476202 RepID=A0ABQ7JCY6_9APIC|nr:ribosomal protein L19 protein [Cardiosporidium cionae]|eukprot:KAF8821808.1 ribosomal protein L19 protein [Cardiosporidium cionae]